MKLKHLFLLGLMAVSFPGFSNPVIIKMNAVSKTMTLKNKASDEQVQLSAPENLEYSLNLEPGQYILSAFGTDNETLNGKIVLNVTDSLTTQQFTVLTCTAYVSNKDDSGSIWSINNGDYRLDVTVNTREGIAIEQTPGNSVTDNRYTFLALNGNSYNVAFIPSEQHQNEGFMTLYRGGTLTANVNVTGAIPQGADFSIEVPSDANLELGMKFTHFSDFTPVMPNSVVNSSGGKTFNYTLANGQVYNYRTWKQGGLTHGGYFTMNTDPSKCPEIKFSEADFAKHDPKAINHSVQSNAGYETGDLFLNINPEGFISLKPGEEYLVHAMRTWELTDNATNNYFFEPDFHYTILGSDFRPTDKIIKIDNADTNTSAWSKITAVGMGTAIVLVTYDGINLNYYNNTDKKEYLGGEYWGAIWPENTGVFVVSVGEGNSSAQPEMIVNEQYNVGTLRLAGKYVDAEHDVFYYLEEEEGFPFTFTPKGVSSVTMATPIVTDSAASYVSFSSENVTENGDGSYTLLLKKGRNIVCLTDASGKSVYQILTAKPCSREITNETRPGSSIFQPGDKIKIQYNGLFHPANKIAGIYNMSAYVTYNGVPNGSSLILGSGQYTFGSAPSAQAVSIEIPYDYDVVTKPRLVMNEGVIQVNGYGDPIGNHRNTSPVAGRSPNFTAVPHQTYFGAIPDIMIDLTPVKYFNISLSGIPEQAEYSIAFNGEPISPNENGTYYGTYGTYSIVANADGYKCYRNDFTIGDDSEENVVFPIDMQLLGKAWDGKTKTEPFKNNEEVYEISTGAELAWFADKVNTEGTTLNAVLVDDIELGNFEWTPIGGSSKKFSGSFNGEGHRITEIYVNSANTYQGLFGSVTDATIEGLIIYGSVTGKQYVGALAGYVNGTSTIDRCANYCDVKGSSTYVGGLVGYLYSANARVTNSYNAGNISGTSSCGGVIGGNNANAIMTNIFNVGIVDGTTVGGCVGGSTLKNNLSNAFSIVEYQITANQTEVTEEQMASGEIAYVLGDAFAQTIGVDPYPLFEGLKVYYDEKSGEYYNLATGFNLDLGEGDENVEIENGIVLMHVMDSYKLSIIAIPEKARLPEISWICDNVDILSIEEGLLSALAKGETVITATAVFDGEPVSKSCEVIVISAGPKELTIDQKEIWLDKKENPTAMLTATYAPDYADEPKVVWSSDDEKVVSVEHEGTLVATIKAIGDGVASIRVEHIDNPEVYDICQVIVGSPTGIASFLDDENIFIDVYDLNGRIILSNVYKEALERLSSGLYIIKSKEKVWKVLIK